MPSKYEETTVEDLDVSKLSDEELKDVAKNDSRTTAQEKAQAEINRREAAATETGTGGDKDTSAPEEDLPEQEPNTSPAVAVSGDYVDVDDPRDIKSSDKIMSMLPEDPEARAEALGLDTEGMNLDPDAGQAQVQAYANAVEESGTVPPTGGPPDDSLTLERVVEDETRQKQEMFAAQDEAWSEGGAETVEEAREENK